MNSSFPNRWSFSYLKFTKYVTNIIVEPKYKYGQQEPVTVRNHNRSTSKEPQHNTSSQCTSSSKTSAQPQTRSQNKQNVSSNKSSSGQTSTQKSPATFAYTVWLGWAMVLGSFQCRGVLLLLHIVGQGPAVLAAGAGTGGQFFFLI